MQNRFFRDCRKKVLYHYNGSTSHIPVILLTAKSSGESKVEAWSSAPREFIRTLRLQRVAQLLEKQAGSVTEIACELGFNSLSHFAKVFKEQFGTLPKDFTGHTSPHFKNC